MNSKTLPVLIILVFNFGCAQDNFYFNVQPKDASVISGQSTILECNVSNTKQIIFYWTLNGDTVANTTRRYQDGSNLRITRVNREKDLGEFKCIAMNSSTGFSLFSSGASLNVMCELENVEMENNWLYFLVFVQF
uniref:Ig-like domain-containing protein n=1 Tax=Strigamia maritima TaxID=126957 RepID=T1JFK3_STRMM